MPIICTEYGPGLKGRVLSSSFAAADLLRTIHAFQEVHTENDPYVRLWYHGLHQGGFGRGPDQYAFGLYMKQGKHLYPTAINFAYRLMSRWGDERLGLTGSGLGENVAAIASRSPKRVAVAVYHVDPAHPMQGGNPAKVRLAIRNLGPRRKASLYRIDHRHHDLYSFWNEQLGRPESDRGDRALSRELHEKLLAKEELTPLPLPAGAAIEDGTLRCTLEVAANGVAFVFVEE